MKFILNPTYIIICFGLALAACSNEDMPRAADDNRIVFRTSLTELTSRATVIDDDNLPYFYVTGFDFDDPTLISYGAMQPLFGNEKVDIVDGKDSYSSPYCCWPEQGKENHMVSFYSFYPGLPEVEGAQLVNTSTETTIDYKLTGFRVEPQITDQFDFITAYTTGNMNDNLFSGISLTYAHQLSRIEVKAHGKHRSCDIEIAGVRIGGTGVECTFDFKPVDGAGEWTGTPVRGAVEYIYCKGDTIVSCGRNHPVGLSEAISIMGSKRYGNHENCAMLIPATYAGWDYAGDPANESNQMYISVLLRVTDATPTDGQNPKEVQRYPYKDLSQGADSYDIPVVYFAVDRASGAVSARLYIKDGSYFTDPDFTDLYTLSDDEEIKDFGWAALSVEGTWAPGYIYTYSLNYTQGVGLHEPTVTTTFPGAGDPVISDKVGMTYTVKEWKNGGGSSFVVPGS